MTRRRYNVRVRMETPVNAVFVANMASLWRSDPRLAQMIDELPIDASHVVEPSRAGPPTALARRPDGSSLLLHSRYDPVREADEFIGSLERAGGADEEPGCALLCGLGLGYHVDALRRRLGARAVLFVAEPDLVTIKTAFETTDLSGEVASDRLVFLTRLDKAHLHERLQARLSDLMFGILLAVPPASKSLHADFFAECRAAVTDFAAFARMSLVTLVRNAAITCRNVAFNLPAYVAGPSPEVLRGRFAGMPAVLVAAGPSLSKNVDQLVELQDRAVIIAAQTTLRPLLERGVTPDFVTSLDFSEMSRQFFENIDIPERVVLVAEPKAAWQAVDAFLGREDPRPLALDVRRSECQGSGRAVPPDSRRATAFRPCGRSTTGGPRHLTPVGSGRAAPRRAILLDNAFAEKCVGGPLARRSPMEAGATVMHLAFYLAQWLGCDPIIFIGQDLGFGGHVYYAPGVAMHRAWRPETGRFQTLEMKEWERIVRQRAILRKVKDIHGRDIYTDEQMFTYLEQFERDFARARCRIIDATEGGARKRGAEVMTLHEAGERFFTRPIPDACFEFLARPWGVSGGPWYDRSRLKTAHEMVAERRKALAAFRALCEETRAILDRMAVLVGDPPRFNALIPRVDELRTQVRRHDLIYSMVREASQLGELQKLAADRRLAEREEGDSAHAAAQLARDRRFIDSLLEGCATLGEILDGAIRRLAASDDVTTDASQRDRNGAVT